MWRLKEREREVLSEDGEKVAFGEVEGNAADENIGGIFVLGVPGGVFRDP